MGEGRWERIAKRLAARRTCETRLAGGIADKYRVGSVWWVERAAWYGCGGFYTNVTRDHHPGLILRGLSALTECTVTMAPGTSGDKRVNGEPPDGIFCPEELMPVKHPQTGQPVTCKKTTFVMKYRQAVYLPHISCPLATLSERDLQRLTACYETSAGMDACRKGQP